jgi:hypothetical protein
VAGTVLTVVVSVVDAAVSGAAVSGAVVGGVGVTGGAVVAGVVGGGAVVVVIVGRVGAGVEEPCEQVVGAGAGHAAGVVELVVAGGGGVVEDREPDGVCVAVEAPPGAVEAGLDRQPVGRGGVVVAGELVAPAEAGAAELVGDGVGVGIVGEGGGELAEELIGLAVVSGGQVAQHQGEGAGLCPRERTGLECGGERGEPAGPAGGAQQGAPLEAGVVAGQREPVLETDPRDLFDLEGLVELPQGDHRAA